MVYFYFRDYVTIGEREKQKDEENFAGFLLLVENNKTLIF
ncbi:hypothetical protein SAMN02745199_1264 [Thermosipho atlanticus DSM 15807]|uniref:Uncharacterized protein n=1 Tax=Thermosipho atlanticus DSM 15807 TaxID=1123380 RepID=A0A1M5TB04_9BACT|nr:hypothetical protein SAMN02745199_1264 [Thermosipho atlanticus DSM 15807]